MFIRDITNKKDEWYTPKYAVEVLLPYIKKDSVIWCPFDEDSSEYVKTFKENGFKVINTHIFKGEDFFNIEVPDCDYIISNPPYSLKTEVIKRLYEIGKPFAMLMGFVGIFDAKPRFNLFKENGCELLIPNRRVHFYDKRGQGTSCPFQSVYMCSGILPKQIVFVEVDRNNIH